MATSKLIVTTIGSIALAAFVAGMGDRLADVGDQQAADARALIAAGGQEVEAALAQQRALAEERAALAARDAELVDALAEHASTRHQRSLDRAGDPPSVAETVGRIEQQWGTDGELAVVDANGEAIVGAPVAAAVGRPLLARAVAGNTGHVTLSHGGRIAFVAAAPVTVGGHPLGAVVMWQPLEQLPAVAGASEMLIVDGAPRLGRIPPGFSKPKKQTAGLAALAPSSAGASVLAAAGAARVWGARFDVPGTDSAYGYVFADIGALYEPLDDAFWFVSIAAAVMWLFVVVSVVMPRPARVAAEMEVPQMARAAAAPPATRPRAATASLRRPLRPPPTPPPASGKPRRRRRPSTDDVPTAQVAVDGALLALARSPQAAGIAESTTRRLVRRGVEIRRLYEQFMAARTRAGASIALSFATFSARIEQIRTRVSAEHDGAAVTFQVVEKENGRVAIRALVPGLDSAAHHTYVGAPPRPPR